MGVRWRWRYIIKCVLRVCCVSRLVPWWSGRLGQKFLYFRERYYPWVSGRGGLRVEVDLVFVSHVGVYTIVLLVARRVLRVTGA